MKKFVFLLLAAALLLGLPSVSPAISCIGAGDISLLTSCTEGNLTFSNFSTTSVGFTSTQFFIGNAVAGSEVLPGTVNLGFQTVQNPNPTTGLADIILKYSVQAAVGTQLTGINIANGGTNVTIQEKICETSFVGGACLNGLLANLVVQSDKAGEQAFQTPVSAYFAMKDIAFAGSIQDPAFLSDFVQSHEFKELNPVPEPATLLLLGSSMAGIGAVYRKRMKKKK